MPISTGHFPQKSPIIRVEVFERDSSDRPSLPAAFVAEHLSKVVSPLFPAFIF